MSLQVRRISGSSFSADDMLEVTFSDASSVDAMVHTVEVVSGVDVTHGGGASSGEYLNYGNDDVSYDNIKMQLTQVEKGTSVVKVKSSHWTSADMQRFQDDVETYTNTPYTGEETTPPNIEDYKTHLETGEITLEWTDDTFV